MKKIVYIIGDVPKFISPDCENNFFLTKMSLSKLGFMVINPIEYLVSEKLTFTEAKRKNLELLIHSDAVFIMNNTKIDLNTNLELKIAFELNLLILNGTYIFSPNKVGKNDF